MKLTAPKTIDDIDAAWLTAALHEGGYLAADISIIKAERRLMNEIEGLLSCVAQYTLFFDQEPGPETPTSLVLKMESDNEAFRNLGEEFHAFEREIKFYETVGPTAPIRVPKLFYAIAEPPCYAIVMEDFSYCQPGDQLAGMPYLQVERALSEIAKLHAMYWDNDRLAALEWMPRDNGVVQLVRELWPSFKQHFGDMVGPQAIQAGERIVAQFDWIECELAKAPPTIQHYDLREDNLLFTPDGTPNEFVIIDWQLAIRNAGARDAARLMAGSETPEQRQGHQEEICRFWHNALVANGVTGYPYEEALHHFKLAVMTCTSGPICIHKGALTNPEDRSSRLIKAIISRCFNAVLELNATNLLPK
ncbi:MAG: oxidoreductase family protein [Verrucomicrobiota bacterium]